MQQPIIFFDGVCGLCNKSVDFLLKKDKHKKLLFAPLQSEKARQILNEKNIGINLDTIILVDKGKIYFRSTAVLKACGYLAGGWKTLNWLRIIPTFIRDFFYNIVAKNRYKWFGEKSACRIPTTEEKERFIT